MIKQHVAYYLGSKIIAAVLNLGTMAMFVRLGGAETYGAYVVALAWAYIIYSFTLQWLRFTFFACYREETGPQLIATYLCILAGGFALVVAGAGILVALDAVSSSTALGVVALMMGLSVYDALHEMGRTRLQARAVAAGAIARAALMLLLGVSALEIFGTPTALGLAVALAHVLATIPLFFNLRGLLGGKWSNDVASSMIAYGRGLIPAYTLDGIGLQVDRLLLARFATLEAVGSYGAVADLIRQLMVVISEAISGAYLTIARAELVAGREDEAAKILGQAFLAFTALAAFGAATVLRFDRLVLDAMFGATIGEAVEPVLALIVACSVLLVFRAYYFAQVSYMLQDSRLMVWSNAVHFVLMLALGLVLAPTMGMSGVALALMIGHFGGCLVYIFAWRNSFVMRLPYAKAAGIVALAFTAWALTGMYEQGFESRWSAAAFNSIVLAAAGLTAARLYNLLSFNDLIVEIWRIMRGKCERTSS